MSDNLCRKGSIFCLSAFHLKTVACILMVIDHVGLVIFPYVQILRIIGRLSFPIFAYFISEGCKYSKNKAKRLGIILGIGILYLIFYYIYDSSVYGNIFLTFSVSISVIYLFQYAKRKILLEFKVYKLILCVILVTLVLWMLYLLFDLVHFEYGYTGMLVPVFVSLFDFMDIPAPKWLKAMDNQAIKLICLALGLILLSFNANLGNMQFFCLLSLPILALYNGRPGKTKYKYSFYIFYPAHLAIIQLIAYMLSAIN